MMAMSPWRSIRNDWLWVVSGIVSLAAGPGGLRNLCTGYRAGPPNQAGAPADGRSPCGGCRTATRGTYNTTRRAQPRIAPSDFQPHGPHQGQRVAVLHHPGVDPVVEGH